MSRPSLRLAFPLLLATASTLGGCGGGPITVGVIEPAPPVPIPPPEPVRHTGPVLTVAGAATDEPTPPRPFDCATGTEIVAAGKRYCLHESPASWPDAEARCVAHGGHLATLARAEDDRALLDTLGTPSGPASLWIGLVEPSEGRWLWSTAAPVAFTAWSSAEPNNAGGNENCGEWLFPSARWNDLSCGEPRPFLCETRLSSPRARPLACSGKGFVVGQSALCLRSDAPATWEAAQRSCATAGGTLAVLDTAEKNRAVATALGARAVSVAGTLWIGVNDRAAEGTFRWSSGAPVTHTAWRAGEPNNAGDEDCTEWSPTDGAWNDLACATPRPSLCEAAPDAIGALTWLGTSEDRVGETASFKPNGKPDAHLRLFVPRGGSIDWISVHTVNAFGGAEGGQLWHTADPSKWVIGVYRDDVSLTRRVGVPLADVPAGAALDLFLSDSGYFKPGQHLRVDVMYTDGLAIARILAIPASVAR